MSANYEIRVFFALRLSALYKIIGVFIAKMSVEKNNRGISPRTLGRFVSSIREILFSHDFVLDFA